MGAAIASAPKANGFVFARSDGELEQNLREAIEASNEDYALRQAIEASNEDYAFRTQLEETLHLSNLTYAYDMQLADIAVPSHVSNPSSSNDGPSAPYAKDEPSSSHSKDEEEYTPVNYHEQYNGFEFQGNASPSHSKDEKEYTPIDYYEQYNGFGGEKGGISRGKEVDTGIDPPQSTVQKPMHMQLCGICFERSATEMFEGIRCLDRFCHPCMTKYVHSRLKQKRRQIYCPNESCGELLTPQECRYFLPAEIIDAWSAVTMGTQSPELQLQKVNCPFPDCSAVLEKEDIDVLSAMGILNAECPFCNRMLCVRCMAPWHGDVDCKQLKT